MSEDFYYRKRGIRVTRDRLELNGGSYALSRIRNVYIREQEPNRKWPLICIGAGLIPLGLGFPLSIAGVIWLLRQKHRYWLCLELDSGFIEPLASKNLEQVKEVEAALKTALNHYLPAREPSVDRESLRKQLLSEAQKQGGHLSVTQGVIATGKPFETVQAILEEMRSSGYVTLDNDFLTGVVVYCFPELLQS